MKLSSSILKITVISTVVVGLLVGVAIPGAAAPDEDTPRVDKIPPNMVRGKVVSIGEDKSFFVIESGEGDEVTIAVDDNTKYFKVRAGQIATLAGNRRAPGQIRPLDGENEEPVSLTQRLMNGLPWLKMARNSQAIPPGQAKKWIEEQPGEDNEPVSLEARSVNRTPGLKRAMVNQLRPRVRAGNEELTADVLDRAKGKGISRSGPARLNWLSRLGVEASFEDIAVGDRVAVRFAPGQDTLTAKLVLIIKAPTSRRIRGTIDAVSDSSITIAVTDGGAVVLNYDENTVFILKGVIAVQPGQYVLASYNSDDMMAKLVRIHLEATD